MAEKKKREYTEARAKANKKYNDKTYKTLQLNLRVVEDADIIQSYQQAVASGIKGREWIRELFKK